MTRHAAPGRRPGFTLIELLVVLVIIGILIGLLLPAIAASVRKARSAAVQAEISQLAQALADFKNKFGDYPPSRVILNESGAVYTAAGSAGYMTTGVNANPPAFPAASADVLRGQLYQRTVLAFRKFWPKVVFTTGGKNAAFPGAGWYDFNGDGTYAGDTDIYLQGHECLVFFLGGIPQPVLTGTTITGIAGVVGFGKNASNPFSNNIIGNAMYSANRNPPLYEFDTGRLRVTPSLMAAYVDSLNGSNAQAAAFFAYFSTNNGAGYDPNDVNVTEMDGTGTSPMSVNFATTTPEYSASGTRVSVVASPSPNPYTSGPPAGGTSVNYINPQTFQIISSGDDGIYGVGGYYNANATAGLALAPYGPALTTSTDPNLRVPERNNLTNFHNGTLE